MRRLFGRRARGRDDDDLRADDYAAPDHAAGSEEDAGYGTDEFEPFVPVGREYDTYEAYGDAAANERRAGPQGPGYDVYQAPGAPDTAGAGDTAEPRRRRRLRVPAPRLSLPRWESRWALRWDALLLAAALVAIGIFGTLLVQERVTGDIVTLWPAALVVVAILWLLVALIRRNITSFLGAAALAGVGLSALMDAQDIARFEETLLGVVLVTLGLGIVMRGFLLRQRDIA